MPSKKLPVKKPKKAVSKPNPIKKLSLRQRTRALVLLRQGMKVEETVRFLKEKYHPKVSLKDVRKKYFPSRGLFAIARLEGASRKEIAEVLEKMIANRELARKTMKALYNNPVFAAANRVRSRKRMIARYNDPVFAEANRKRSGEIMRALHKDPVFAEANRKRMRALHKDPVFAAANRARSRKIMEALNRDPVFAEARRMRSRKIMEALNRDPVFAEAHRVRSRKIMTALHEDTEFRKKRLEGIARHWNTYRLRLVAEAEKRGIGIAWEHQKDKPVSIVSDLKDAQFKLLKKERSAVIERAFSKLSDLERNAVELVFGFTGKPMPVEDAASVLGKKEKTVENALKRALKKLGENKELKELQ